MKKLRKIIWAIDPFSIHSNANLRALEALSQIAKEGPIAVEPVYVLGSESLNWIGHMAPPNMTKFKSVAIKAIDKLLFTFNKNYFLPPKILLNKKPSRRADVKTLCSYAKRSKTSVVLLTTHTRPTIARMFLGSFAETVLFYLKTPMLFIKPTANAIDQLQNFLVPSDLTSESKKSYQNLLKNFKGSGKSLELFYQVTHPINAFVQSGVELAGGGWVSIESYLDTEEVSKKKQPPNG